MSITSGLGDVKDVAAEVAVIHTLTEASTLHAAAKSNGVAVDSSTWTPVLGPDECIEGHRPLMMVKLVAADGGGGDGSVATCSWTVERAISSRKTMQGFMGLFTSSALHMNVGTKSVPPGFTHFYTQCGHPLPRKKFPAGTILLRRQLTLEEAMAEGSATSTTKVEAPKLVDKKEYYAQKPKMKMVYRRGPTGGIQKKLVPWHPSGTTAEAYAKELKEGGYSENMQEIGGGAATTLDDIVAELEETEGFGTQQQRPSTTVSAANGGGTVASAAAGAPAPKPQPARNPIVALLPPKVQRLVNVADEESEDDEALFGGDDESKKRKRDDAFSPEEKAAISSKLTSSMDDLQRRVAGKKMENPLDAALREMGERHHLAALSEKANTQRNRSKIQTQFSKKIIDAKQDISLGDAVWRRPTPNILTAQLGPYVHNASSTNSSGGVASNRIAAFGIENTLLNTSLFNRGPNAWSLVDERLPALLKELSQFGYRIILFQNYPSLHVGNAYLLEEKTQRIVNFVKKHCPELTVGVVLSVVSQAAAAHSNDAMPHPNVFSTFVRSMNFGVQPNKSYSFFVGTEDGRTLGAENSVVGTTSDDKEGSNSRSSSMESLFASNSDDKENTNTVAVSSAATCAGSVLGLMVGRATSVEKEFAESAGIPFVTKEHFLEKKGVPCWE